jgi:hypothetical protein
MFDHLSSLVEVSLTLGVHGVRLEDWDRPTAPTGRRWPVPRTRLNERLDYFGRTINLAARVLRLRIVAIKNSMKRRLAPSPTTRTIDDSASSPARTNTAVYYFRRPGRSVMASTSTKEIARWVIPLYPVNRSTCPSELRWRSACA